MDINCSICSWLFQVVQVCRKLFDWLIHLVEVSVKCGVLYFFCLDLFSPFRSAQGLRIRYSLWTKLHSALPPLSLFPPSSSTSSSCCLLCLLPFSLNLSLLCFPYLNSQFLLSSPTPTFSFLPIPPPIVTSSPRGHVAHLGDDEDEDDDGADDDETHTQ